MARFPRHTNAHFQAAIEWLEANGWTINRDGTITRVKTETKKEIRDPRLVNAAPRHVVTLPDRTQFGIKVTDLVLAKFGRIAAIEQPDEVEVGLWANLEPETCPEPARVGCDEAVVGQGLSFAPETRSRPAGRGHCGHCHGNMLSDSDERRCLQCGRTGMPPRVLSAEEHREFRRRVRTRNTADAEIEELTKIQQELRGD